MLQGLRAKQEEAQGVIGDKRDEIARSRLPEDGIPAAKIAEMNARIDELRALDASLDGLRANLAAAAAREEQARLALGGTGEAAAMTLPGLNRIAAFVRNWNETIAAEAAAMRWREWLGDTSDAADLESLHKAALVLAHWLRSSGAAAPAGPRWLRPALLILAGLIAVASGILALTAAPTAWLGLVFAAALVVIAFVPPAASAASPETMFPAGRVEPPRVWEVDAVQQRLEEIQREMAAAQVAAEKRRELEASEGAWQRIDEAKSALVDQCEALCAQFNCRIDPNLFETFVRNVGQWRVARSECEEFNRQIANREEGRSEVLKVLGEFFKTLGISAPADFSQARAAMDDLSTRDQCLRSAQAEIHSREREHEQLEEQCRRLDREIATILELAEAPDRAAVADLLRDFSKFIEARDHEKPCRGLRNEAQAFFQLHPELETMTAEKLEQERAAASALGDKFDALLREKTEIETRIGEAKRHTALQDAVARRETARRALIDYRDDRLRAHAGHLLAEHLREQMGELSMPPVFDQARNYFARFTSHAWELVPPDADGNFRARDTAQGGLSRPLAELSSGTRVQLLLAVRAAFVANEERAFNVKLPLLLDETLANSDDQRAQHIIDAIAELARDGRQIFYFTAQADEVAKWRDFFSRTSGISNKIVDLAGARGETATVDFEHVPAPPVVEPPAPDGLSYDEYHAQLRVPPFDPREEIGAVHLWHLCEDTAMLHRLLCMGFERWGQVNDALRHGGEKAFDGISEPLRANARLLEELCQCWRHGRSKPLVREALVEGGVSPNFIERVWSLACTLDRDAQRLLEALENREVSGFRRDTIAYLAQYFLEHGYVTREEPLDPTVIRSRLLSVANGLNVDPARVEPLLAKIFVQT